MVVTSEDVNRLVPPADDSRNISEIIATYVAYDSRGFELETPRSCCGRCVTHDLHTILVCAVRQLRI